MAIIPIANSPQFNGEVLDSYIIAIQTGRETGAAGYPQMKNITVKQLKNAVEKTLSALFTFRGVYSSEVPSAPLAVNDYFYCNANFTDAAQDIDDGEDNYTHTFYQYHLYAYNGTVWADITPLLIQGMPVGGTTGQVLKKVSNADFDVEWSSDSDQDTKNTAGATDSSSKLYIVGAPEQTANPQTYTQDTAYVGTDGALYSENKKVLTDHQDISGKADKAVPSAANNIALLSLIGNLVDSGISKDALQRVLDLIPAQADPTTNQLADKEFVNSSVATNTATFRGSYNLVSDLSLSTSATQAQIAAAIATYLAGHSISADNNDYVFIQIPTSDSTPTEIREIDRYKFNGTAWSLEYPLNNSGFTAAQWAAINSNITAAKVTSYDSHLANNDVHVTAAQKTGWTNAIAGIQGTADAYDPDNESYAVGDPCIYNNVVYIAKEAITAPAGAFDAAKWERSDLQTLMNGVKTNASAISDIIKHTSLDLTTDSNGYTSYDFNRQIRIISVFLNGRNGTNVNGWMVGFSKQSNDYIYRKYYFVVYDKEGSSFGAKDITIDVLYQEMN